MTLLSWRASMILEWYYPANIVSLVRLLAAWVPAYLYLTGSDSLHGWIAVVVFGAMALTDVIDGALARGLDQVTEWGKFLDPLVDKVLVATTLVAISVHHPWLWMVTALIITREVVITLQIRATNRLVAAVTSGKLKMLSQVIMLLLWLAPSTPGIAPVRIAATALAVAMTIYSWIDYNVRFVRGREG